MVKGLALAGGLAVLVLAAIATVVLALSPGTDAKPPAAAPVAASQAAPPALFALRGAVILERPWVSAKPGDAPFSCTGAESYADIRQGAQVVVTDTSGTTIGLGKLGAGQRDDRGCVFQFEVANVPAGQPFYGVEVPLSGRRQYTASQVASHFELRVEVP
ncbi:hypothetical protein [Nonomuraea jabiensis]|uniref:Uncharacterized protein n=1 Tax=Nonomuraea jabiensis TaxID=882448 RepID=A0A7W9G341_9ACTN|nr:hypothetical protein [Nonomuraea jabiensis]MBB5776226.1 hypothetical protein [Nonomuraea jabiensis]